MKLKVHIIINPASGPDYPILAVVNRFLHKNKFDWEIAITKDEGDAVQFTKRAIRSRAQMVVAVGGDGTVMEIGQALVGSKIPMLIVPAGTANVLSKDLGIPQDPVQAIELLEPKRQKIVDVDTALMDGNPFLIRISTGILAHTVKDTTREAKDKMGNLAYALTTIKNLDKVELRNFHLNLDGKEMDVTGNALMIANSGNIGLQGVSIFHKINVTDSKLDVIVLKQADLGGLISVLKGIVTHNRPPVLFHRQAKKVTVTTDDQTDITMDDHLLRASKFTAEIAPQKIKIIVPK